MKHVNIWIADDGTRFNNELDCQEHEKKHARHELTHALIMMDEDNNILTLEDNDAPDFAKWITILRPLTDSEKELISELFWIEPPTELGTYHYDDDKCEWYTLAEELSAVWKNWKSVATKMRADVPTAIYFKEEEQ